ncbi:hypothetical protein [uncultured Duncaniella sp.]|nr:hypothetical protein [uncultured Duncaniella sp.]
MPPDRAKIIGISRHRLSTEDSRKALSALGYSKFDFFTYKR